MFKKKKHVCLLSVCVIRGLYAGERTESKDPHILLVHLLNIFRVN